jgi:peptidoglycan/xylan/chitin deacetylase (PgdA/CDA1 family)
MLGSKEAIEERTRQPVRFFCYPAGHYDDLAIDVLKSANYWGAVTVAQGSVHRSDRLFELKRIRIRGSHRLSQFAALLEWEDASLDEPQLPYTPRPSVTEIAPAVTRPASLPRRQ